MWNPDRIDCPREITMPMLIARSRGSDAGSGRVKLKPFAKDSMQSSHNGRNFQQHSKPVVLFQQGVNQFLPRTTFYQLVQGEAQVGDGRSIQDIIDH